MSPERAILCNFAPNGPQRPAQMQLRTAVSRPSLARRKPRGSNPLTSSRPWMTRATPIVFGLRGSPAPQLSLCCPGLVGVLGELDGDLVGRGPWAEVGRNGGR